MAARSRQGIAALIASTAVVGTVLVLYLGSGSSVFETSEAKVTDTPGPNIDGTFGPDPSTSAGPDRDATDGSSPQSQSPPSDGGTADPGANTDGGSSGSDVWGWDTKIQQPQQSQAPSKVDGNINPGVLAVSTPNAGQSRLAVDRATGTAKGTLNSMLVQDFRGSRRGWTLTGEMSDFRAEDGTRIAAANLTWTPYCNPHPGRGPYPSSPKAGSRAQSSRSATLCSTSSSTSVTGGEFDVGADLILRLPDRNTSAESYSATLTLTLS
jgi:hypothetical protein